jgi:hypothetical protein
VFEHEKPRLPESAWPPTGWFAEWTQGIDRFDLPAGKAPIDMRWLVYRGSSSGRRGQVVVELQSAEEAKAVGPLGLAAYKVFGLGYRLTQVLPVTEYRVGVCRPNAIKSKLPQRMSSISATTGSQEPTWSSCSPAGSLRKTRRETLEAQLRRLAPPEEHTEPISAEKLLPATPCPVRNFSPRPTPQTREERHEEQRREPCGHEQPDDRSPGQRGAAQAHAARSILQAALRKRGRSEVGRARQVLQNWF